MRDIPFRRPSSLPRSIVAMGHWSGFNLHDRGNDRCREEVVEKLLRQWWSTIDCFVFVSYTQIEMTIVGSIALDLTRFEAQSDRSNKRSKRVLVHQVNPLSPPDDLKIPRLRFKRFVGIEILLPSLSFGDVVLLVVAETAYPHFCRGQTENVVCN